MSNQKVLSYDPKLKELAKQLRKNSTLSEVLLWQQIRGKKLKGYDFHRQKPIDHYIVDFFCPELMLAIEIDGITHDEKMVEDVYRQRQIESLGIYVLRFSDSDVKDNLAGVLQVIEMWIEERRNTPRPMGTPSLEGNGRVGTDAEVWKTNTPHPTGPSFV